MGRNVQGNPKNNAKGYVEQEGEVGLLTIVAEDRELEETKVKLSGSVGDEDKGKLDESFAGIW